MGADNMSVFVHAGGRGQKWQNSVHVVVECPLYHVKKVAVGKKCAASENILTHSGLPTSGFYLLTCV